MPTLTRMPSTCRRLVVAVAAATVLSACGSDDRSGDNGPPCDCPEFIELIDTIDWSTGRGSLKEATIYMVEDRAHVLFGFRADPLDAQDVAADIVRVLADEGLEVSEGVESGLRLSNLKVSYDVRTPGGELTVSSRTGTESSNYISSGSGPSRMSTLSSRTSGRWDWSSARANERISPPRAPTPDGPLPEGQAINTSSTAGAQVRPEFVYRRFATTLVRARHRRGRSWRIGGDGLTGSGTSTGSRNSR